MTFFSVARSVHWIGATRVFHTITAFIIILLVVLTYTTPPAQASDHQDTTFLATNQTAADMTDLFVFESATDPNKVVLAMDFDPLIVSGQTRPFDPSVLYQFKTVNHNISANCVVHNRHISANCVVHNRLL